MILVDTSVWILHFRGRSTPETTRLETLATQERLLVGDLILLELLQGARDDNHASRIERELSQYAIVPLLDTEMAPRAARHYRRLRALGITIRKTADIIIGTFCIEHRHALLHADRDFDPMEAHLGLRVA